VRSLETTEPTVDLVDDFLRDGGFPHGNVRLTISGSSLAPTTIKLP
jgi:hypothetical protein